MPFNCCFLDTILRFSVMPKCISNFGYTIQHDQFERPLSAGKTEFDPDEDAHVIGDCVKVCFPFEY